MTTLHDRLVELAEDAPRPLPAGAGTDDDLWGRGRRRHRRRQAGTGALALMLVVGLGALSSLVVQRPDDGFAPADARQVLALPDRLYTPSPWLRGTDETGPLGLLVAVVGAERRSFWGATSNGLVGVSGTGAYAFLDLPGRVRSTAVHQVALSDDGRYVAYPMAGTPPPDPHAPPVSEGPVATGVAVYDTQSGEVQRRELPSEHGRDIANLFWVGNRLVIDSYAYNEGAGTDSFTAHRDSPGLWNLATGAYEDLDGRRASLIDTATPVGDRLVDAGRRRVVVSDLDGTEVVDVRLDAPVEDALVTRDVERVALLADPDGPNQVQSGPKSLLVAELSGRDQGVTRAVPGVEVDQLVGWRDNDHVVALQDGRGAAYWSIDVRTGEREELVRLPEVSWESGTVVAQDALSGETFVAPAPEDARDPRVTLSLGAAGGLLVALLLGVSVLGWRRRGRG